MLLQKKGLQSYKKYGENNEQAQKLFYELQEQPSFKAFFYVSLRYRPGLLCHIMCTGCVHLHMQSVDYSGSYYHMLCSSMCMYVYNVNNNDT